jgi:hypothetical protein
MSQETDKAALLRALSEAVAMVRQLDEADLGDATQVMVNAKDVLQARAIFSQVQSLRVRYPAAVEQSPRDRAMAEWGLV